MGDLVHIDGSYGEGGGQILRTSAALSAITGRPVEVANIRAKRTKPGLQPQHSRAVQAVAELCGARLKGDSAGSQYLLMEPAYETVAGAYRFDIGTAGSTTLVFQAVCTPLLLAKDRSRIVVTGGTHNEHAPCAEYVERVFLPCLRRLGAQSSFSCEKAGFYPRGGGEIAIEIETPHALMPLDLKRVVRGKVEGYSITSLLKDDVGERGQRVLETLAERVEVRRRPSLGPGAATFACIEGLAGFTGLGRRGVRMEDVARDSVGPMREFLRQGAQVDEHLSDQLVLPLCFATGPSTFTTWQATEHLRTVAWVVEQFEVATIRITERGDGTHEVEVIPSGGL